MKSLLNCIIISSLLLFLACFPNIGINREENSFVSNIWKNADRESGEREAMLSDLEKKLLSKNTIKSIIVDSLGKADSIENSRLLYLVSQGFDPCYLILEFNKLNRLDTFEIECH